ncbi:MAG: ABC transporter substrate-binding protein [Salinivirgaceae bacterium]|jgi:iron complex transport system substrate-binding protein|nr:ABC transporter substrate-binding protein [Salinivirgaceae bacterium]
MKRSIITVIAAIILFGCQAPTQEKNQTADYANNNCYASHFSITENEGYSLITIKNPWVDAENIKYNYAVAHTPSAKLPPNTVHIKKTPTRVAAISTTHIAFIETIGQLQTIKAVSDKQYIYSRQFHKADSISPIAEVGFDINLNVEKLLQLKVELVFLYGISNEIEPLRKKLVRANIIPVMIGEYMEQHPLGKAEWIKVFGAIFQQQEIAKQYFNQTAKAYEKVKREAATTNRPTVLTGMPWNDVWHTPGGKSFTAQLIADAGGNYIFSNDTSSVNYQYDTEIVYQRAGKADIWINAGNVHSLKQIEEHDNRMKLFKAFQNGNIFNNNKRSVRGGGSDYMESGAVNPHKILSDLAHIFHGNAQKSELTYYKPIN